MAHLMIVDDDEDFATSVSTVLRNAGHEIDIERDIDNATRHMERRRPDLVILDIMFPEDASAGFELARTMRHHNEKLKGIPILMLTAINARFRLGFGSRDIDDRWLPVSGFLEKPVDIDMLQEKVNDLLQNAEPSGKGECT